MIAIFNAIAAVLGYLILSGIFLGILWALWEVFCSLISRKVQNELNYLDCRVTQLEYKAEKKKK